MADSPSISLRVPLMLATARLRLAAGPPERLDPVPVVSYRAPIDLDVIRPADGTPKSVRFRIDTGAGVSQMSLAKADELGVRIGDRRGEIETTTADGTSWQRVVVGAIKVRFPGSARTFLWDCLFFVDRPPTAPSLLGLKDVIQSLRVTVDRTPVPGAPDGSVLFEDYPTAVSPAAGPATG